MAANTGRIIKGSKGRIDFGSGFYANLDKYSVEAKGQALDQTSFESSVDTTSASVFQDGDVGVLEGEVQISGYWDSANNPFSSPPNLVFGAYLSNVRIYVDKTNVTRYFAFTSLQVMSHKTEATVKGRTEFSCTLACRGSWTLPS